MKPASLIPLERIQQVIFLLRGEKVMLSQHLANLYGVSVGALNQAVKRNAERFPEDFMFHLSQEEFDRLKSQIVISSWGGLRRSLSGENFSGLQLMCLMHAGFKRLAPEHDTGMDLDAPFLTALELFNAKQGEA